MEVYVFPLSKSQQQLWYRESVRPGNSAYNVPLALKLVGRLDEEALANAIATLIERHEILRTTIALENGQPVQLVHLQLPIALEYQTLQLPQENAAKFIDRLLQQEARRPFDLVKGPLFRAILYRLGVEENILFVNLHHTISDGWSLGILVRELATFYTGGNEPELPIQYGDFAEWQQQWLASGKIQEQLSYWEGILSSSLPALELPTDAPRPARASFRGRILRQSLDRALTDKLEQLARQQGATLFMAALAVYAVLLFRYSDRTDLLIGTPIANRQRLEVEQAIGFFVNTLPLRLTFSEEISWNQLLALVQRVCLEAYSNQDVPFEVLVERFATERDPSRSPLVETLFAVQNAPLPPLELPGLRAEPIYLDNGGAKFDLSLMLEPEGERGWQLALEYNTDLFALATATQMISHYQRLMAAAVAAPHTPIARLPWLSVEERSLALSQLPEPKIEAPANLVAAFIETARIHRDRVALKSGETRLTYGELQERVACLAAILRDRGVRSETRVGIFLERGEILVIAILAVLSAGGTYVPLDPKTPRERLSFIATDSGMTFVLTQAELRGELPPIDAEILLYSQTVSAREIARSLPSAIVPQQAAYIIYTSGSTGKPKGCSVSHGNVVRLFSQTHPWFEFGCEDVWTLFHSFAFDFAVWEMWGALFYGGTLVVVPYWESRSPQAFRHLLAREKVTVLNQTPSAFRQLMRVDADGDFPPLSLRWVIFGGEALELQSLRPWLDRYGDERPRLVNMYGITETTVHVTYRRLTRSDITGNRGSVIGCPIPDMGLYILDHCLEPTPIGVPGEIYVAGAGVSRGYLHQPRLSAKAFIPDPFSGQAGSRLYRTGDLARRIVGGEIEYLGRLDLQVKVRGFRIELGEIESALVAQPHVAEAVVVVRSDGDSTGQDKRLVAYLVLETGATHLDRARLRSCLAERLPDYEIPAAFVVLESLPLTIQGKVDRSRLPVPDWNRATVERVWVPPETESEKALCRALETALSLEAVGIADNFFDLGGDSILALKVVVELRRLGWSLTPKDLFGHSSVKDLAATSQRLQEPDVAIAPPVGEVELTPIQRWFFELEVPHRDHWNQAILLEVAPPLHPEAVAAGIEAAERHHDAFRLRFRQESGQWRQFYVEEGAFDFAVADLSDSSPEAIEVYLERVQASLDLAAGPLARAVWLKLGAGQSDRLLLVCHHLIIDGVSWRLLLEDLLGAVAQHEAGGAMPLGLPAATATFQQWSQALHELAKDKAIEQEARFWLERGHCSPARLPRDFPTGINVESSLQKRSWHLNREETQLFLTKANQAYRTRPQELLIAALLAALNQITGETCWEILLEGHGREEIGDLDISRTVGWFTSLYPLQFDLEEDGGEAIAGTLIQSVKERMRSVPRRGMSYGVWRYLRSDTEVGLALASMPSPEMSVNYLGQVHNEGGSASARLLNGETGLLHDPCGIRPQLVELVCLAIEGELHVEWLFSANIHRQETIAAWMDAFGVALRQLLSHCTQPGVGAFTPADFPLVELDRAGLQSLLARFPNLEDLYPLSPLQEGMLFHSVDAPGEGIYCEQVSGRMRGRLDVEALAAAWQAIVDRHAVLRTAFVWEGRESALQVVLAGVRNAPPHAAWKLLPGGSAVEFTLDRYDWRGDSPQKQQEALATYLERDRRLGFLLERPPQMRFALIQLGENTWQWVWSHHHILLDGWSLPVLFREVLDVYEAILQGVPHSLPPVVPYRQYIQRCSRARDRASSLRFWQATLAGANTPTRLPRTLPHLGESAYQLAQLRLDETEFAEVQAMAKTYRLTLSTLAQGAWALVLQKHGAGEDVLFGITDSGRPPELLQVETMVGLFINTLPLRVQIQPQKRIDRWLQELQQLQVHLREYSYTRLREIQKASALGSGEALFESILVFENYPVDRSLKQRLPDLHIDDIDFWERTNYPLTVGVIPDEGLLLKLNYEQERLSPPMAEVLLERFRHLLLQLVRHPRHPLGQIAVLTQTQRQQILTDGKGSQPDWGGFRAAHQLVAEQARATPNAIALVCEQESLSYKALVEQARALANPLRQAIADESIVGLYLPPSQHYIVAMLAVLEAGGAFLPLDPHYPPERLQQIVADARPRFILTVSSLAERLESWEDTQTPHWQIDRQAIACEASSAVQEKYRPVRADRLAYIIYTSGSSGRPKGVALTHAGIQNLARAQAQQFGLSAASRVYQFASLNFDAAISEIFTTLATGATLYLQGDRPRIPSPELWQSLTAWGITHLTLPPSLLAAMEPQDLPTLKGLIVAGEAASGDLLRRWSQGGVRVFNAYGPTEATVCTTIAECSSLTGEPSLGQPLSGMELLVLDPFLEPVPPGVPGEIYIGGVGLARGYLGRRDLTAAAFVPHPYSRVRGARLYRSGDRAVRDESGRVYFLGRFDNQVKVRAARVELGEIEAVLTRHPAIAGACALLREDNGRRPQLVAYGLVKNPDDPPTPKELQNHLATLLPAYMMPGAVVVMSEWPLTPNGKLDRAALPLLEVKSEVGSSPQSETEGILGQIWAQVLQRESVGTDENFFELGGDSIVSLQVVSLARKQGIEIAAKDIFAAPTLSGLAARARTSVSDGEEVGEPLTGLVPLSPIQHWFFEQNYPQMHHWNQAVAIALEQPLQLDAFKAALAAVVAHHDVFRLQFVPSAEGWLQSYVGEAVSPSLEVVDLRSYPDEQRLDLLAEMAQAQQRSFDLQQPPLWRLLYVSGLATGEALLLFAHHLVVDGVSWRILLEDLEQAYRQAIIAPQAIVLEPKTASYRCWSASVRELARTDEIEATLPFWQHTLAQPILELPFDYPAGANTVESMAVVSMHLSHEESRLLLSDGVSRTRASVEELLLAALWQVAVAWGSLGGAIDLESHGREDIGDGLDLSRTVGWFTALYPLFLAAPSDPSGQFPAYLKAVKQQLRAVPHKGASFGMLRYLGRQEVREALLPPRFRAQIGFNYLGQFDRISQDSWFQLGDLPLGSGMSPQQLRPHAIAINAWIGVEGLCVDWSYSRNLHAEATIRRCAESHLQALKTYLDDSQTGQSSYYTPSDFRYVELETSELDSLLASFENPDA